MVAYLHVSNGVVFVLGIHEEWRRHGEGIEAWVGNGTRRSHLIAELPAEGESQTNWFRYEF